MRRRILGEKIESDSDYVTSIDGEKIKVLQVVPKEYDPNGFSIRDEIYEENCKRYIKKQVKEDISGQFNFVDSIPARPTMIPEVNMRPYTSMSFTSYDSNSYYERCKIWIDGIEVCGWNVTGNLKFHPDLIGINFYRAFPLQIGIHNPNSLSPQEVSGLISNKTFRYAVPEEEIETIEIM